MKRTIPTAKQNPSMKKLTQKKQKAQNPQSTPSTPNPQSSQSAQKKSRRKTTALNAPNAPNSPKAQAPPTSPTQAVPMPKTTSIEDRIKILLNKGHLTAEEIFFLEIEYTAAYFNGKELFSKAQRDKIHKKIISTKEELEKINALCGPNGLLPALTRMISQGVYYFDQAQGHLKTLMILQDEARIKKILGSLLGNLLQNPDGFLSNLTANFADGPMGGSGAMGAMSAGPNHPDSAARHSAAMGGMEAAMGGKEAAADQSNPADQPHHHSANFTDSPAAMGAPPNHPADHPINSAPSPTTNFLEEWLAKQEKQGRQGGKFSGKEKWTKEKIIERLLSQINFPMVEMIEDQKTKEVPNALLQRIQTLLRLGFSNAELCLVVAEKIGKRPLTAEIDEAKNMFGNIMIFFHRMLSKDELEKWAKRSGTPLSDFFNPLFPFQMVNQKMPSSWPTKAKQQKARQYANGCTLVELDIKKLSKILGAS